MPLHSTSSEGQGTLDIRQRGVHIRLLRQQLETRMNMAFGDSRGAALPIARDCLVARPRGPRHSSRKKLWPRGPRVILLSFHAELSKRVGTSIDGMLVHVGACDDQRLPGARSLGVQGALRPLQQRHPFPLLRELAGDQPLPSIEQTTEAFDVRGSVIPGSNVYI
jgi:hypothetical protein